MAVAFDAVGPGSTGASQASGTTMTWAHTCTGANRAIVVVAALGDANDAGKSLSATYAGTSMTSLGVVHTNNSTAGFVQVWILKNPASGANNVVVTVAGGTYLSLTGGSVSFTGVNQTTPNGTAFTAFGNSSAPSVGVTGTTSGNMVIDGVGYGTGGTDTSSQTLRVLTKHANTSGAGNSATSTANGSGGTVTMAYTLTTADFWGILGVEILASSGTASPNKALKPVLQAIKRAAYY